MELGYDATWSGSVEEGYVSSVGIGYCVSSEKEGRSIHLSGQMVQSTPGNGIIQEMEYSRKWDIPGNGIFQEMEYSRDCVDSHMPVLGHVKGIELLGGHVVGQNVCDASRRKRGRMFVIREEG